MNIQNSNSDLNNNNNQENYYEFTLRELKHIASQREITPNEGNKQYKQTWIDALEEHDRKPTQKDVDLSTSQTNQPDSENSTVEPTQNNTQYNIDLLKPQTNQPDSENPTVEPKGSEEAENYILENIVTALDQRRIDVNQLQINFDGQNIFKMNKGDIANSTVTNQQKELIEQALNDPASFKGSIKITNGSQVLLHVKDGQVLRDGLNLTKSSTKVEINSAPENLYDKYAAHVNSKGLKATKEVAVNALSDGVKSEQVKEIIKSKDSGYSSLLASAGKNSADDSLNKIVASASAEVKTRNQKRLSEEPRRSKALSVR